MIVEQMINSTGLDGVPDRMEAARVLALAPDGLGDLLGRLLRDENPEVARMAITGARLMRDDQVLVRSSTCWAGPSWRKRPPTHCRATAPRSCRA